MNWNDEAEAIMRERFGGDSLIALATAADNIPWVRVVNATYQDGYFYIITYDRSQKDGADPEKPQVAISGELVHLSRLGRKPGMVPERGKTGRLPPSCGRPFPPGLKMGTTTLTMRTPSSCG